MNVNIILYNMLSDPLTVNKQKSQIKSCTCQITDSFDVDEMDIKLDIDASLNSCNYAYIDSFSRYYFLTPGVINGNQMVMHATSDPLSSFWDSVSQSECVAERSSSHPNPNLADDMLPFKPQPVYDVRQLSTGFTPSTSGGCYILTVGGK